MVAPVCADIGDPQIRTDHPWYPGELACSTFERLFTTQSERYRRVIGVEPKTEEQKALASWFFRNGHYYHGMDGRQDLCGKGFAHEDNWTREYWTGLFGFGFALCGTTHAQWSAEMEQLLGHARGRTVGVDELCGPVPVQVRLRRRKARWEVEHEAAVRDFLRSRA